MKAVAPGDKIAVDLFGLALVREADLRPLRCQVANADTIDLEQQRPAVGKPAHDQVLHHFLLSVDGHALVDQGFEIDAVQAAIDADIDAPVQQAFGLHPLPDPDLCQQVGGPMFDQPGADAVLDVVAATVFDDDRFDAGKMQQPRQHQPGRARSNNADLRAHI